MATLCLPAFSAAKGAAGADGSLHRSPRYSCWRGLLDNEPRCIAFGGLRVDDAIEELLLGVVEPGAIAAAVEAERNMASQRDQVQEALLSDLQAARYAADRAFQQYDASDPENRRWRRSSRRAGTRRSHESARSRIRLAAIRQRRHNHLLFRHRRWQRLRGTCVPSGRRPLPMQGSRNASCARSSMKWSPISMM